ncbi:hypothetical protein BH721_01260 [Clostridium baratii]|uniref:ImmA/IrrE family metallo-endopeptidase n=1 Tax=Clostridium baratii TaxID=1561 RepID=UPI0009A41C8E|nr:ImmA/IrrE family metallo-endopeptidase [Clostridium baratii]OPF51562.1 hypothetical protein A1M12_03215 [Clostridium baratii]OPF55368.1 hypothetical protein BH721_01260 [Clostridium baratii]OPF57651.1 hypothetical protein BH724_08515 [Clostridium baratii]OPF60251.1 hypothetical protein BH725_06665 [Clostridium baratii]
MEFNYAVPTGYIIKEYIEEKNISEETLKEALKMSTDELNRLFDGKVSLSEDIAIKLESLIPEVSSSYWLNLERKYNDFLNKENDNFRKLDKLNLKEISEKFKFKEVFKGMNWDIRKQALEMLNILKIDSYDMFNNKYSNLQVDFFEDGGEKEAIAVWLGLCEEEAELQEEDVENNKFILEKFEKKLKMIKAIANNSDLDNSLNSFKKLCNKLGVYFVELEAISNCKVRGALTTFKNHPAIFISRRFKTHDHTWFAIMHEIGHLLLHYNVGETLISMEESNNEEKNTDKEEEANEFARNFFIPNDEYNKFITRENFSEKDINVFAAKNKIQPGILVARLQHDGYLKMYEMNNKRTK